MKRAIIFLLLISLIFSKSYNINEYVVNIQIDKFGDITVQEDINLSFYGSFSEGWRDISIQDIGKIENVKNERVRINEEEVWFELESVDDGDKRIHWYYDSEDSDELISLNFDVEDRVEVYEDEALFCWALLPDGWGTTTDYFSARIELPEGVDPEKTNVSMYSPIGGSVIIQENIITILVDQRIYSDEFVATCIMFDKSIMDVVEESRKDGSVYDSWRFVEEPITNCLVVPIIGTILFFAIWFKHGRDPPISYEGASVLPPTDMPPAILPGLMNEGKKFKGEMITGTIIDLIARGYLEVIELEKERKAKKKITKERTILILKKRDSKLKNYEKELLAMIFPKGKKRVDLDQLMEKSKKDKKIRKHLTDKYGKIITYVNVEIKSKKFFEDKNSWMIGIIMILGFIMFFIGIFMIDAPTFPAFLFTGGFLLAFIGIPFASVMSKRTKKWFPIYEKWKRFESAISGTLIKEKPPSGVLVWERILAYATVLGKADTVMKNMEELKVLPKLIVKKIKRVNNVAAFSALTYSTYTRETRIRSRSHSSSSGSHSGSGSSSWSSSGGGFSSGGTGGGGFR